MNEFESLPHRQPSPNARFALSFGWASQQHFARNQQAVRRIRKLAKAGPAANDDELALAADELLPDWRTVYRAERSSKDDGRHV